MRALLARTASLLTSAAAWVGCGGNPPSQPDPPELTTVEITPDTATLFIIAPRTTVELSAAGKDQDGETMDGVAAAAFSTGNDAVATVDGNGTVTAVALGTAVITASMTAGEITRSGTATITVRDPPSSAAVQAPMFAFRPKVVDVAAGGSVSWTMGTHPHDVVFTTPNAPENVQPSWEVTVFRTFPTPGVYLYHCLIHQGMNGSVQVH
jgi:plastocyanin